MSSALVVGSAGQDGRILVEQLRAEGHEVVGTDREGVVSHGVSAPFQSLDLRDATAVRAFVAALCPSAIYYLAAHHHASDDAVDQDIPGLLATSLDVNVLGLVHILDAVKHHVPLARVFYAASSHVFGVPESKMQDEETPQRPNNVYGITKSAGMNAVRFYREQGILASAGILYNHESIHRPAKFISMRLVHAARAAKAAKPLGTEHRIEVRSLGAIVDWGYAPDYTRAMQRILGQPRPTDYVIATGEPHTVADFAEAAFAAVGLDYRAHVTERAPRAIEKQGFPLVGDARKLRDATGWRPTVTFREMVSRITQGVL